MNKQIKEYTFLGLIVFAVFLILSIVFYKERIICMDFSLVDVAIIIKENFVQKLVRFGGAIPQVVPLLGTIIHLPLKLVLLFHSIGMVVFYLIFFILILFRIKNFVFGFALLLFLTLLVSDNFYWICSEFPQGMAYLCLYGAWLMEKQNTDSTIKHWWLHFLIILWIQFFYLLIVFPIVFMFCFLFLISEKRNFKTLVIFISITIASFIIRYFVGKLDWYELEKIQSFSKIINNISQISASGSFLEFIKDLKSDYLIWGLIFLVTSIVLILKKHWKLCFLTVMISSVYLVVVLALNPVADKFYIQNMFLPLGFIVALPFLFYIIKPMNPKTGLIVLTLIFSFRIGIIYAAHQKFTNRITWFNSKIRQIRNGEDKIYFIPSSGLPMDTLLMTWAVPYETLLLSSLNNPDSAIVIKIEDEYSEVKMDTLGIFPLWKMEEIPTGYFNLQ